MADSSMLPTASLSTLPVDSLAVISAHLPNFAHKMRLHSFGGQARTAVNLPSAWRDVGVLEEKGGPDVHNFVKTIRFIYRSRCSTSVVNEFCLSKHRSSPSLYTVRFNDMRYFEVRLLGWSTEMCALLVESVRDAMSFVRTKTRALHTFKSTGVGLNVFVDVKTWLPATMRACLEAFECTFEHGLEEDDDALRKLPAMPTVTTIKLHNLTEAQTAVAVGHVVVRRQQLRAVRIKPRVAAAGDKAKLPAQVLQSFQLRYVHIGERIAFRPSQVIAWPYLETITGIMYPKPWTMANAIRACALLVRLGRSLTSVEIARRRYPPDVADEPTSKRAIAWGKTNKWRLMTRNDEVDDDMRVVYGVMRSTAQAIVDVLEAIHSSNQCGRSVKICLNARPVDRCHALPLGFDTALRHMLARPKYGRRCRASVELVLCRRTDDAEPDVRIVNGRYRSAVVERAIENKIEEEGMEWSDIFDF